MTETDAVPILLLEPDQWRFRGIESVLEAAGEFKIIGEPDFAHVLTLEKNGADGVDPRVVLVADRLIVDYGLSIVPHLLDVFVNAGVLVHGDHDTLDLSSRVLFSGASGYFDLSAPIDFLREAVEVVAQGRIWAPRDAVALLAQRLADPDDPNLSVIEPPDQLSDDDLMILRYLREGLSNREMAAHLQVAEMTIKARLEYLYRAFGATTRMQLVSAAMKKNLVVT